MLNHFTKITAEQNNTELCKNTIENYELPDLNWAQYNDNNQTEKFNLIDCISHW